jgi:hypothetical protein
LNKYFSHEFTEQLIDRSVNKVIENRNVPFLNYQWNSEFQNNYSLFTDGGFRLNEVGSEIFGRKVFHDLKGYGIQVTNEEFGERIYDAQ